MCKQFPLGWRWQRLIGLALGAKILFIQGRFLFLLFSELLSLLIFQLSQQPPHCPRAAQSPPAPDSSHGAEGWGGREAVGGITSTDAPEMGWLSDRRQFNPFPSLRAGALRETAELSPTPHWEGYQAACACALQKQLTAPLCLALCGAGVRARSGQDSPGSREFPEGVSHSPRMRQTGRTSLGDRSELAPTPSEQSFAIPRRPRDCPLRSRMV